jgi:hypothetical protein
MDVIIDGVLYVPAKEVVANRNDVAKALLLEWWGSCSDEKLAEILGDGYVYVCVNDDGEGVPIEKILNNLATI